MQTLSLDFRVFTSNVEERGLELIDLDRNDQKNFHGHVWVVPSLFLHHLNR